MSNGSQNVVTILGPLPTSVTPTDHEHWGDLAVRPPPSIWGKLGFEFAFNSRFLSGSQKFIMKNGSFAHALEEEMWQINFLLSLSLHLWKQTRMQNC